MNSLAVELNNILDPGVCFRLLSEQGKRFYFPKGIVVQSEEAKLRAHKYNATIGMAYTDHEPIELKTIRKYIPELKPAEAVSYAPTPGDAKLRKKWQEQMAEKNPAIDSSAISLPLLVPGLTTGLSQIADLFVDEGDTIVIPDMFWGNYTLNFVGRKQGCIVNFPFFNEEGGMNIDAYKKALLSSANGKKILTLLNFPNNPTGYTPTEAEGDAIAEMFKSLADGGYDLLVISDDAYFGLFYEEGIMTQSIFSKVYNLHPNILAVKVDGATKEDYVWGFRIGFITIGGKGMTSEQYEAFNKKLGGCVRATISNSSRIGQTLLLKAMEDPEYPNEKRSLAESLKKRYTAVKDVLQNRTSGKQLEPLPFNSGYFMSFQCTRGSAEALRLALLEKGVGTISIKDTYLRIAYASVELDEIEELYNIIFETADEVL